MSTVLFRPKGALKPSSHEADIAAGTVTCGGRAIPVRDAAPGVPFTGRVYGTLFNYPDALAEAMPVLSGPPYNGPPEEPVFYFKPANTLAAYGDGVVMPPEADRLAIEGSIGVVIGSPASRLTPANALSVVQGYTLVCDVSIPSNDFFRHPLKQRCRDGFCPAGPWVVPAASLADADAIPFRVSIDGEVKAQGNTGGMIRSLTDLLVALTSFMTLFPGDVLLTGSPGNAPTAMAGQTVRIEADAIGALENTIVKGGAR